MITKIQKEALALLKLIIKKEKLYSDLNEKIKELQGDFPTHIQSIDSEYFTEFVKLLDLILGDELASYLLWECSGNGSITDNGKEFKIRNVADIQKYMEFRDE